MTSTGDIAPVMIAGSWILKKRRQKKEKEEKDNKVKKEAQELVDKALSVQEDLGTPKPDTTKKRDQLAEFLASRGLHGAPIGQYSYKLKNGDVIRTTASVIRILPVSQAVGEITVPYHTDSGDLSSKTLNSVLMVLFGLTHANEIQ